MSTPPGARRRHLASSPFKPDPVPTIEDYEVGDLVSHDSYGMGRVVGTDAGAVTVDFRDRTVRVTSPFAKMSKL
jgi:predicted 2-oxoglutarate/Fe(II)-dependent dioxygenase YbiX